jgi:hypothetical protein
VIDMHLNSIPKYRPFIALVLALCLPPVIAIGQKGNRPLQRTAQDAALPDAPAIRIGGRHKPSVTGAHFFRALVLFVRFRGDDERSPSWPDPERLPDWAARIVDRDPARIGSTPWNLYEYYRQNSNGKFRLVGDVFYITLDSTEEYYHRQVSTNEDAIRARLVRDALNILHRQRKKLKLDLRRYDNWSSRTDFVHAWKKDGIVDMIWFITRNYHWNPYPDSDPRSKGYTLFGRTSADFMVEAKALSFKTPSVTNTMGIVTGEGSGINVIAPNLRKRVHMFDSTETVDGTFNLLGEIAHEFSHYFFGSGHFGNRDVSLAERRSVSSFSGLAVNTSNGFGHHHGLEKLRLGWITGMPGDGLRVVPPEERDATVRLEDVGTTGPDGIRLIKIPVEGSDQYFLLENRGWKGPFEPRFAPYNTGAATLRPGVLLTQVLQEDDYFFTTRAQVKCADGKYTWRRVRRPSGDTTMIDPVAIEKDSADALTGYDERETIFPDGPWRKALAGYWTAGADAAAPSGPYFACTNCPDSLTDASDASGDRWDLFHAGDVITPWSNPAMCLWDGKRYNASQSTAIGIHIVSFDTASGACTIRIVRGALNDLPPARPTGLKVAAMRAGAPVLRWSPNREPRFIAGGNPGSYEIQRADGRGAFRTIGAVRHPRCEFVDTIAVDLRRDAVQYRLRAVDTQGLSSNPSEPLIFDPAKTPPAALRPFLPWWRE